MRVGEHESLYLPHIINGSRRYIIRGQLVPSWPHRIKQVKPVGWAHTSSRLQCYTSDNVRLIFVVYLHTTSLFKPSLLYELSALHFHYHYSNTSDFAFTNIRYLWRARTFPDLLYFMKTLSTTNIFSPQHTVFNFIMFR